DAAAGAWAPRQAAAALATLRLQWRFMGSDEAQISSGRMLHYLFTRVLGLRLLLQRNLAVPFFELDAVMSHSRDEFPESRRGLAALTADDSALPRRAAFFKHYAFLDEQLRHNT